MPPSFLEYVLDLSGEQIADLQAGAPDVLTDLVSGAIARLVIQTERAKDHDEPDPEGAALVRVHDQARQRHEGLRNRRERRQQPVSRPALALAVSARSR